MDKETNYYFYNARHYDPEICRFVTADTVIDGEDTTQGWNRYAYVKNNPIVYKDPTGHASAQLPAGESQQFWNETGKSGGILGTVTGWGSGTSVNSLPGSKPPTNTGPVADLLGKQKDRAVWALTNPQKAFEKFHNWAREPVPTYMDESTKTPMRFQRREYGIFGNEPLVGHHMTWSDAGKMYKDIFTGNSTNETWKYFFAGEKGLPLLISPIIQGVGVDHDNALIHDPNNFYPSMIMWSLPKGLIASQYNLVYNTGSLLIKPFQLQYNLMEQGYNYAKEQAQSISNRFHNSGYSILGEMTQTLTSYPQGDSPLNGFRR